MRTQTQTSSNSKLWLVMTLALIAGGVGYYWFGRGSPTPAIEGTAHENRADRFGDETPAPVAPSDDSLGQQQPGQPSGTSPGPGGAPGQPVAPPALSKIREEVHANPHQTPASLLNFAENIANRIEEAEESPEKAQQLFEELEGCVLDGTQGAVRSIQALCLTNAEDLVGSHPELKDRFDQLNRRAPPEVMKLLESAAMLEQ